MVTEPADLYVLALERTYMELNANAPLVKLRITYLERVLNILKNMEVVFFEEKHTLAEVREIAWNETINKPQIGNRQYRDIRQWIRGIITIIENMDKYQTNEVRKVILEEMVKITESVRNAQDTVSNTLIYLKGQTMENNKLVNDWNKLFMEYNRLREKLGEEAINLGEGKKVEEPELRKPYLDGYIGAQQAKQEQMAKAREAKAVDE